MSDFYWQYPEKIRKQINYLEAAEVLHQRQAACSLLQVICQRSNRQDCSDMCRQSYTTCQSHPSLEPFSVCQRSSRTSSSGKPCGKSWNHPAQKTFCQEIQQELFPHSVCLKQFRMTQTEGELGGLFALSKQIMLFSQCKHSTNHFLKAYNCHFTHTYSFVIFFSCSRPCANGILSNYTRKLA